MPTFNRNNGISVSGTSSTNAAVNNNVSSVNPTNVSNLPIAVVTGNNNATPVNSGASTTVTNGVVHVNGRASNFRLAQTNRNVCLDPVLIYMSVEIVLPAVRPDGTPILDQYGNPTEQVFQCETSICINTLKGTNATWLKPYFKDSAENFKQFMHDLTCNMQPGQIAYYNCNPFRIVLRASANPACSGNQNISLSQTDAYKAAVAAALANVR